jgi:hypothetical protein
MGRIQSKSKRGRGWFFDYEEDKEDERDAKVVQNPEADSFEVVSFPVFSQEPAFSRRRLRLVGQKENLRRDGAWRFGFFGYHRADV